MTRRPRDAFAALKIKHKIGLGFGALTVLLGLSTAIGYQRFRGVSILFDTYAQRVEVAGISQDIEGKFLDFRRHVREFALAGAQGEKAAAMAGADDVAAEIATGVDSIHVAERHRRVVEMRDKFASYRDGMTRAFDMRSRQDALVLDRLDPDGRDARAAFHRLIASPALAARGDAQVLARDGLLGLMDMRLAANKMVARHDAADAAAADRWLGVVLGVLARLDGVVGDAPDREVLAALRAKVSDYADAYHSVHDLADALNGLVNGEMREQAETIAADATAVVASARTEQKSIGASTHAAIAGTMRELLLLGFGGLALGVCGGWLISRGISRPVARMSQTMMALAGGNLEVDIPAQPSGTELGQMTQAMHVFRKSAADERALKAQVEAERRIKDGRQIAMDRHTQDFGVTVSGVMGRLIDSAATMRSAANETSSASERTTDGAAHTTEAAQESSRRLHSVSLATEHMSSSIGDISKRVMQAAADATEAARRVTAMDAKVAVLAQAAERIGSVVKLITAVAEQTNLLSLNATIEAARAGDAGKGFSVVAGEVKALAKQTTRATEEISTEVGAIRSATQEAVESVSAVTGAIGRLTQMTQDIAAAIEQQGAATREIAGSVQVVTSNAHQTLDAMQLVSQSAQAAGATSQAVLITSDEVGQIAATLRAELNQFLSAMSSGNDMDRRRYERRLCSGIEIGIEAEGLPRTRTSLHDISRGGTAFATHWKLAPGTELALIFQGEPTPIGARWVRSADGVASVAFLQSPEMLARIDRMLDLLLPNLCAA